MPTVPVYDNLRTSLQPAPGVRLGQAPGAVAAEQGQQLSKAVMGAAGAMEKVLLDKQREADELRVADALNQLASKRIDLQVKATQLQGRNALERPDGKALPDEFGSQLDEQAQAIASSLGNDQQRQAFSLRSGAIAQQLRGALAGHMAQQQQAYERETFDSSLKVAANQAALLWRDPAARQQGEAVIDGTLAQMGKVYGWDKPTADAKRMEAVTALHVGVIRAMLTDGQATAAREYFEANSASLTLQARAQMLETTKNASMAAEAQSLGAQLASKYGPTETAAAQREIDALGVAPELKTAIRAEVEHRHRVVQADQDRAHSEALGKLSEMVERGMSQSQIEQSPDFLAVRDRGAVLRLIRQRQEHLVNLQAAKEARDYTRVQRLRAEQEYQGQIRMFQYSDPQVLASMSRTEVAGLALELGPQNTSHLLAKYDALQKPGALGEAKIDNEQFAFYARQMGVDPAKSNMSDAEKARVQDLRNAVETVLAAEEVSKKRRLTRPEKDEVMRREMARKVTLSSWAGLVQTSVPLLTLRPADLERVVVPAQDVAFITDALRRARGDQGYKPTREELSMAYLARQMRGAGAPASQQPGQAGQAATAGAAPGVSSVPAPGNFDQPARAAQGPQPLPDDVERIGAFLDDARAVYRDASDELQRFGSRQRAADPEAFAAAQAKVERARQVRDTAETAYQNALQLSGAPEFAGMQRRAAAPARRPDALPEVPADGASFRELDAALAAAETAVREAHATYMQFGSVQRQKDPQGFAAASEALRAARARYEELAARRVERVPAEMQRPSFNVATP